MNKRHLSKGYGASFATENGMRRVHRSIRNAKSPQSLYYRATVILTDTDGIIYQPAISNRKEANVEGAYLEASQALISEALEQSADTDSLVIGLFQRLNAPEPSDSAALLLGQNATVQKKVDLAVKLLALADVQARSVHGIHLEEQRHEAPVVSWLEAYENDSWISYEPATGARGVPEDYLAWWHGMEEMVKAQGAKRLKDGLAVPELYGMVETEHQVRHLDPFGFHPFQLTYWACF